MPLTVNLRHLEEHNVRLRGELPVAELDLETGDEMIQVVGPLRYDVEVQKLEDALLVRGSLQLGLECRCVRCLQSFTRRLDLKAGPATCRWKAKTGWPWSMIVWT